MGQCLKSILMRPSYKPCQHDHPRHQLSTNIPRNWVKLASSMITSSIYHCCWAARTQSGAASECHAAWFAMIDFEIFVLKLFNARIYFFQREFKLELNFCWTETKSCVIYFDLSRWHHSDHSHTPRIVGARGLVPELHHYLIRFCVKSLHWPSREVRL